MIMKTITMKLYRIGTTIPSSTHRDQDMKHNGKMQCNIEIYSPVPVSVPTSQHEDLETAKQLTSMSLLAVLFTLQRTVAPTSNHPLDHAMTDCPWC